MKKTLLPLLLCATCTGVLLFMGAVKIDTWEAEPDPTLAYISQEPQFIMMGDTEKIHLSASGPSDYDTKTSSDCTTTKILVADDVSPSYWQWYNQSSGSWIKVVQLETLVPPTAWPWRTGDGDHGASAGISAFFVVTDTWAPGHDRHDSKAFWAINASWKLIPDMMDTMPRTDVSSWDPYQLGCYRPGTTIHQGLRVWHPIQNQTYPNFCFDGMTAKERIRLVTTNGITSEPIRNLMRQIMLAANGESTAGSEMNPPNPANCMNDFHAAGTNSALQQLMTLASADTVTLWQTWHITTGGWDNLNHWPLQDPWPNDPSAWPPVPSDPDLQHAIGMVAGGFSLSHFHFITYKRYQPPPAPWNEFIRVWKDGVTCLCNGPSW